jgi:nitrile hydratase accessory protein
MQPDTPVFEEPWQAEALALAMALMGDGRLSNAEWSASLGAAIKRATEAGGRDDGSTYYEHVLNALEQIVLAKSMATADELAARKEAWRAAYSTTPHGQPVLLNPHALQSRELKSLMDIATNV